MLKLSSLAIVTALIWSGPVMAEPVRVAVKVFYCSELSSESQHNKLNYIRLGEGIGEATWMGVVRAPTVKPGPPQPPWCREMMSQEVNPATCRAEGNPAVVSGALGFEVVETLIGTPTKTIEVAPEAGIRLLLNTEYRARSAKSACQQANLVDNEGVDNYFSPAIISLDPRREFVLLLKPGVSRPEDAPNTEPGVWASAFAVVEQGARLRADLRQAVKMIEQQRRDDGAPQP